MFRKRIEKRHLSLDEFFEVLNSHSNDDNLSWKIAYVVGRSLKGFGGKSLVFELKSKEIFCNWINYSVHRGVKDDKHRISGVLDLDESYPECAPPARYVKITFYTPLSS
jgi:hypothetical protein